MRDLVVKGERRDADVSKEHPGARDEVMPLVSKGVLVWIDVIDGHERSAPDGRSRLRRDSGRPSLFHALKERFVSISSRSRHAGDEQDDDLVRKLQLGERGLQLLPQELGAATALEWFHPLGATRNRLKMKRTRYASVHDLPDEILKLVLDLVVPKDRDGLRLVLRSVCKHWNVVASKVMYDCGSALTITEREEGRIWTMEVGYSRNYIVPSDIFFDAMYLGHARLCYLACEWNPRACADAAIRSIYRAARVGDEFIFAIVEQYSTRNPLFVYDTALLTAAQNGHENICRIVKERGAVGFESMFDVAENDTIRALAAKWILTCPLIKRDRLQIDYLL